MRHRSITGLSAVIAGLDPAIHEASQAIKVARILDLRLIMDARVKPAHDAQYQPIVRVVTSCLLRNSEADLGQRGGLPRRDVLDREGLNCLVEQSIEIELRRQMQENRT